VHVLALGVGEEQHVQSSLGLADQADRFSEDMSRPSPFPAAFRGNLAPVAVGSRGGRPGWAGPAVGYGQRESTESTPLVCLSLLASLATHLSASMSISAFPGLDYVFVPTRPGDYRWFLRSNRAVQASVLSKWLGFESRPQRVYLGFLLSGNLRRCF
jgi:hypothetical protein